MMEFLTIFSIQIVLMLVGYLITILIGNKNRIEALGLSYLYGSGLITVLFLVNHFLFKMSLGAINFLFSSLGSILILFLANYLLRKPKNKIEFNFSSIIRMFTNLNCFEKFILSFLIIILAYTLLENYVWPITDWDSLALYDFRARVMAKNGNMLEGIELGYFFQYPPYTSFLHVFGYVFGAERVKIIYSFLYASFLMVFYSLIRRTQARWISLAGVFMLAIDNFIFRHATMAYTNMPYVVFLSLGVIYLIFWLSSSNKKDLITGSVLVGLSTWVRASDPFWYLGVVIIIIGIIMNKKDIKNGLILILSLIGIYKFWDIFVSNLNMPILGNSNRESKYINVLLENPSFFSDIIKSIPEIVLYFWQNVSYVAGYLLPLLIFTIYYDFKYKNKANIYLYVFLVSSLLLILAGIMVFSLFYDTWNQIADSLQRISMVLIPITVFIIFNSKIWKKDV